MRLNPIALRGMLEYVSGQDIADETLIAIERRLHDKHPELSEADYKYNLAARLSGYAQMMKSQH